MMKVATIGTSVIARRPSYAAPAMRPAAAAVTLATNVFTFALTSDATVRV